MALSLYNTLTGRVEPFAPAEPPEVRMYVCGPTVYGRGHIGNFRSFVATDLLRRTLRYKGWRVREVMNITDVDDRIIQLAAQAGSDLQHVHRRATSARSTRTWPRWAWSGRRSCPAPPTTSRR